MNARPDYRYREQPGHNPLRYWLWLTALGLPLLFVFSLRYLSFFIAGLLMLAGSIGFVGFLMYEHYRHRRELPWSSVVEYCALALIALLVYISVL